MNRRVYILVPGILTSTSDASSWCVRMSDDIMRICRSTSACATEFRYFSGPFTRRIKQRRHAVELASVIESWGRAGFEIVLVGHSNGCDLIERAVRLSGSRIRSIHLIAAASKRDFCAAGYIERILSGSIGEISIHFSKSDSILSRFGKWSGIFSVFGLGYGRLGELGPINVPEMMRGERVRHVERHYMGHSDWFNEANYLNTLEEITALERK